MYLEFYGLKEMPFGLTPDPRYIFKTESHLEVLATLRYAIEHNKGLVVITGEVGTGKTTTLRAALQQFTREHPDGLPKYAVVWLKPASDRG